MAWDRIRIDANGTVLEFIVDNGTIANCYMLINGRVWYLGAVTPIHGTMADLHGDEDVRVCDPSTSANIRDRVRQLLQRNVELAATLA